MSARGNNPNNQNNHCPYCNYVGSTDGWVKWHVSKYHPGMSSTGVAAHSRETVAEFRRRYAKCEGCHRPLFLILRPELVGYIDYREGDPKAWCVDCVETNGMVKVDKRGPAKVSTKGG
jgi:hypothetical protein